MEPRAIKRYHQIWRRYWRLVIDIAEQNTWNPTFLQKKNQDNVPYSVTERLRYVKNQVNWKVVGDSKLNLEAPTGVYVRNGLDTHKWLDRSPFTQPVTKTPYTLQQTITLCSGKKMNQGRFWIWGYPVLLWLGFSQWVARILLWRNWFAWADPQKSTFTCLRENTSLCFYHSRAQLTDNKPCSCKQAFPVIFLRPLL